VLAVWPVDTVQRDETSFGVEGTGRGTRYVGLFHLLSQTVKRTRNNVLTTLFCVPFPVLWIKVVYCNGATFIIQVVIGHYKDRANRLVQF